MVQRFLWHARDLKDDQLNTFFISALLDLRVSLILQDENGNSLCVTNLPDCWSVATHGTPGDSDIFGEAVAAQLAQLRGVSLEHMETVTTDNFLRTFNVLRAELEVL